MTRLPLLHRSPSTARQYGRWPVLGSLGVIDPSGKSLAISLHAIQQTTISRDDAQNVIEIEMATATTFEFVMKWNKY